MKRFGIFSGSGDKQTPLVAGVPLGGIIPRKLIDDRSDLLIIYSRIHIDQQNRDVLPINDGSDIPVMMLDLAIPLNDMAQCSVAV
jgi:hypothetical protein